MLIRRTLPLLLLTALLAQCGDAGSATRRDGSASRPLLVMIVPSDGGTEDGTKRDFEPLFRALHEMTGLWFALRVGESYAAVIEGLAAEKVDIAFVGPVAFLEAEARGAAELLGVAVEQGASVYWSGIFVRRDDPARTLQDLRGQSLALGDPNSTSSFHYPMALLLDAGVDPVEDLDRVVLAGNHVSALTALSEGRVTAAAAAITSFERAVGGGAFGPTHLRLLAKSAPIPNPPLVVHPALPPAVKGALREALGVAHQHPTIRPGMIRGYGGKAVERYDVAFAASEYRAAQAVLSRTDGLRAAMLQRASR